MGSWRKLFSRRRRPPTIPAADLTAALDAFIGAETWEQSFAILIEHERVLVSDATLVALRARIAAGRAHPPMDDEEGEPSVALLEQHLALLEAVRATDLAAARQAFAERSFEADAAQDLAAFEAALTAHTREAVPLEWATIQYNLGNAYCDRLDGDRAENVERAIAAYDAALTVYTAQTLPVPWAMTQYNLGAAYSDRILGDRAENVERTIAAYELALTVYTPQAHPADWAATQNNLGNAYRARRRGGRAENLVGHTTNE